MAAIIIIKKNPLLFLVFIDFFSINWPAATKKEKPNKLYRVKKKKKPSQVVKL